MIIQIINQFEPKKEYAVGEKFLFNGIVLVVKRYLRGSPCASCVFQTNHDICDYMRCKRYERKDKNSVYFDFYVKPIRSTLLEKNQSHCRRMLKKIQSHCRRMLKMFQNAE